MLVLVCEVTFQRIFVSQIIHSTIECCRVISGDARPRDRVLCVLARVLPHAESVITYAIFRLPFFDAV